MSEIDLRLYKSSLSTLRDKEYVEYILLQVFLFVCLFTIHFIIFLFSPAHYPPPNTHMRSGTYACVYECVISKEGTLNHADIVQTALACP